MRGEKEGAGREERQNKSWRKWECEGRATTASVCHGWTSQKRTLECAGFQSALGTLHGGAIDTTSQTRSDDGAVPAQASGQRPLAKAQERKDRGREQGEREEGDESAIRHGRAARVHAARDTNEGGERNERHRRGRKIRCVDKTPSFLSSCAEGQSAGGEERERERERERQERTGGMWSVLMAYRGETRAKDDRQEKERRRARKKHGKREGRKKQVGAFVEERRRRGARKNGKDGGEREREKGREEERRERRKKKIMGVLCFLSLLSFFSVCLT